MIDVSPAAIRERQQQDVRKCLKNWGGRTVEEIGEATILPRFSVLKRLTERPDWFEELSPGIWRAL